MVLLGDVGEIQEMRERTRQRDRGVNRQRAEQLREIGERTIAGVCGLGQVANVLDDVEQLLPAAFAQRVAEQCAQQADVLPQRLVRIRCWVAWVA